MLHIKRLVLATCALLASMSVMAADLPIPSAPSLGAKTYVLVDYGSGQTLAAKNPDQRVEPASVTKLMTAYIVFDEIAKNNLSPDDMVTVSKKAWEMKGSQMFLKVGDKVSVDKLIHGLITASGNDAAVSLAEYVAGTTSTFVDYMNQYAKQLGMGNSRFQDVNGLPQEGHYMSARDIATLYAAIVREFPKLYDTYFHNKKFAYNGIQQYNRNTLLWSDDRVDGGKTGHTESAGYNLVASAKADGMRVISVVTGTNSENARKSQAEALISYAFRFYQEAELFGADKQIAQIRVWKGDETQVPVVAQGAINVAYPRGKRDKLTTSAELPATLSAPVEKGERLGTLAIKYNDQVLKEEPLYAGKTIAEGGYIRQAMDEILMMFQ
ncbi:D-alanyl-D-alanine carboxypeptidase family protein [Salinisphaera japonica]|uniref:serine-type D-Ala-D-Ala carboxypeptidase n=1 Tax=Salinisphaera japonica YTM-1 TaxID=1209778 RepID=A0A423PPG6_9GAMM|nr:D-alanyl-D-alanine carboxypeptidase family protein [Salinisphaera japonica]ROO27431.1 D-alanyl-D-alanine carboxypeptidase [Salinisphaera japonica YTM-1]